MHKDKMIFKRAVMIFCSLLLAVLCISVISCSKMVLKPFDYENRQPFSDSDYGHPSGENMW